MQIEGPLRASHHYYHPDDPAQTKTDNTIFLLMFKLYTDMNVRGLALRRVEIGPNKGCYERIGTFDLYFDFESYEDFEVFSNAPKTLVTII